MQLYYAWVNLHKIFQLITCKRLGYTNMSMTFLDDFDNIDVNDIFGIHKS